MMGIANFGNNEVAGVANLGNLASVIDSFACKETAKIFRSERSRKFPGDIQERAKRGLMQIHMATELAQIALPPSNHLHPLQGDLAGFWAIKINKQWRIVFRWEDGRASHVKITDYH
jgi:proteic killer suppression protein